MVKRFAVIFLLLSYSLTLAAQETLPGAPENVSSVSELPDYLRGTVDVLYRFHIDEDFYFLANEAGVYIWDSYAGNFPSKEYWIFSIELYLSGSEKVAHIYRYSGEPETTDPIAEATQRNIPVFVDIEVTGDITTGTATVHYVFTDLFSSLHTLDKTFVENIPTEDDLLLYYWIPIKTDLDDFIKPILKPLFTVWGPVGAEVSGFTVDPFIIPEAGSIRFVLPLPGTYEWTMSHKKYVYRTGIFFADKDKSEITLPAQKFYPSSLDIGFFLGCFPEIWYTRNLNSRSRWFFSVGLQQQIFGFFPQNSDEPLKTSFNTLPLIMPGIAAGYRFKTAEPYIPKLYLEGVLQTRINIDKDDLFDDFSPLSFSFYAGYEWEMPIFLKLFAEIGASVYFLKDSYKDSVSKGTGDKGFIQQVIGDAAYIELPSLRLGIKVELPF